MNFFKKYFKHFCFAAIIAVGAAAIFLQPVKSPDADTDKGRIEFIEQYGWQVEKTPYLCEKVQIPITFDHTLNEYNEIQKRAGFDLSKYRGAVTDRFSYRLLNNPRDLKYAYINVFVYQKKIIAADIVSPKIDGFISAINDTQAQKKR
ncbi:MAG: DUF4830 domain-containing protein [Clostridia bacterium]|nr:DUF4830 domain-containing protein [Clostridia bacterium]